MASGEDRLIERFFKPLARHPAALALADDAAAFAPPAGRDLVLTKDALVAGVHFFSSDPPDMIARKALRVNLSDLAAKGARPEGFLLALALPKPADENWLRSFAEGLGGDADTFGCPLFGGDTIYTPGPLTVSITALGTVPSGTMVKRSGASVADRIFVTGTIGDAALGLALRREGASALGAEQRDYLAGRYLLPQPRNALAEEVRTHASAAMDVSDGLAGDLAKLCSASGVSARIEVSRVPLSDAVRATIAVGLGTLETALTGGDDYEIACTIPPGRVARFQAAAKGTGIAVTEIGEIVTGTEAPVFLNEAGAPLAFKRMSFSHF